MEKLLREWRQDAINKHQYESAIYIGDKLLALTNDPKDAFWLAQVHFSTGNYTRAQSFLNRHDLLDHSPSCRYLAAHCHIKQGKYDDAFTILGEKDPSHLITSHTTRRKLHHRTDSKQDGTSKAGRQAPRSRTGQSEDREMKDASDIKFEAAMCYLRGICYAKQNAFDRAKESYKNAVRIDVQCFEAFDQLMKNSLMSPDEEWAFLESLDFDRIPSTNTSTAQEAAQFVKMLYTTRLSKYKNTQEFVNATDTLSSHYSLAKNHDLLLAKADMHFTQCRFSEALEITSSILESDEYNFTIYPLHIACLSELGQTNRLFLLSHQLADLHPQEPATWLAVGAYYLSTNRVAEARRFFSKASMMDPHFGPAWIGFAHTFAAEGEHDQAISAYSTAARLFQGTHLPPLFLGMQNLQLNNLTLAQEYLSQAHSLCNSDPLVLNELGVTLYHLDHLEHAIKFFTDAIILADNAGADPRAWISAHVNLGHAYRRLGQWEEALAQFDDALRTGEKDASIFTARGLVLLELQKPWEAVVAFHDALGVQPQDPVATDLLQRALEELSQAEGAPRTKAEVELDSDAALSHVVSSINQNNASAKSRTRQRRLQKLREEGLEEMAAEYEKITAAAAAEEAGTARQTNRSKGRLSTVRQSAVSMMISSDEEDG